MDQQQHSARPSEAIIARVSDTAVVSIGGGDVGPEYSFDRIKFLSRLDNGAIVVADQGSSSLRFYTGNGTFVRSVGRKGEGPAEFVRIDGGGRLRGDTIVILDRQFRTHKFTANGEYAETRNIAPGIHFAGQDSSDFQVFYATFWLESGVAISASLPEALPGRRESIVVDTALVALHDGTAWSKPFARMPSQTRIKSPSGILRHPQYGGRRQVTTHGNRLYYGLPDEYVIYELEFFPAGDSYEARIVRLISRDWVPEPVTSEDKKRALEYLKTIWNPQHWPAFERDIVWSKYHAPYTTLKADRAGRLWVQRPRRSMDGEHRTWDIFSHDGEWLTTTRIAHDIAIYEIGTDYVLGVWKDEWDVEHIRMYDLFIEAQQQ